MGMDNNRGVTKEKDAVASKEFEALSDNVDELRYMLREAKMQLQ